MRLEEIDRDHFVIDYDNIDQELDAFSESMFNHAEGLAQAKAELEVAETHLELVEAQVAAKVRKTPAVYGFDEDKKGPTVQDIKGIIIMSQPYQAAKTAVLKASKKVGIFAAAVKAMDSKRSMLGKRVDLAVTEYYSGNIRPKTEGGRAASDESVKRRVRPILNREEDDDA